MDDIDKQIINGLTKNGRTSFREISKNLDISHSAVKKRFDKLIDKKEIKITCLTNHDNIKLTRYLVLLSVVRKEQVKNSIKKCMKSIGVFDTHGEYNLALEFLVEDLTTLDCILEKCINLKESNVNKKLVLPMISQTDNYAPISFHKTSPECDNYRCEECELFKMRKCAGCRTLF